MNRDEMNRANQIFFYRTNCAEADTVGSMGIIKQGFIVHIAVDPKQKYYEPKNEQAKSR